MKNIKTGRLDKSIEIEPSKVLSSSFVCIACKNSKFNTFGKELIRCGNCSLVLARHIPSEKELSSIYSKDYFFGDEYSDYFLEQKALEKNFKIRIKNLKPHINQNTRFIEVGCAYGYFLDLMKTEVSWYMGFDISEDGIAYAKDKLGLSVTLGNFTDNKSISSDSIDLICMWDVIEHFREPHKQIQKASQLLRKGGVLCLSTGDIGSFNASRRGLKWRMIHPPTHIYYFNRANISLLLAKNNLIVERIRYRPIYRNVGAILTRLISNAKDNNHISATGLRYLYTVLKKTHLDQLNIPINLYDLMEVTAVKI